MQSSKPNRDEDWGEEGEGGSGDNGMTFASLMQGCKRVLSEPPAVGGGFAAAVRVFREQLSSLPEACAHLCQEKCFQIKKIATSWSWQAVVQ